MKKFTCQSSLLSFGLPILFAASRAVAQTNGGTGVGLDSLDEKRVMGDLASYKLTTLLDRDFETFKISPAEQEQTLTILKIDQLVNGNNLRVADRRALAAEVAKGFDGLLPKLTDPEKLFQYANELFTSGVVPTVTELEYFGENPVSKAQLKPTAETVKKMYAQVSVLALAQGNAIGNSIKTSADLDRVRPKLLAMKQAAFFGNYSDNMATYSLCISLDDSDTKRKELADGAIKFLSQFDKPETGVQAQIRLQIGKLQLVSGDFDGAKKTFDGIVENPDQAIKPAPEPFQQNDARYFGAVAEIASRNLQGAQKDINDLDTWEKQSYLPTLIPGDQQSVRAAMSMLKFRLFSGQSDLTSDQDEKKKTNDQAINVLSDLLKQQPGLKDLVFDQLLSRIPAEPDYASLNPLVLQAIQQQGFDEVVKKEGEPFNKARLNKAIPAAQELVKRRGKGVDEATATLSAYFIPYAYQKLEQKKDAAGAFMDFAQKFQSDTGKATDSLTNAEAIIKELRERDKEDPITRKLYDRFLPLAIGAPYNQKRFAYGYASLLLQEKQFKKAVTYYKQVPEGDKLYPEAQFSEMLALSQQLNDPTKSQKNAEHKKLVDEILKLSEKIDTFFKTAKDAAQKKKYLAWVVVSDQIAADLSRRELKDPARSLQVLTGFEDKIKGAKDEKTAGLNAMRLRISDYMDLGKVDDATKTLVELLKVDPDSGQALMFDVLKSVSRDKDAAAVAGNTAEVKKLAVDQAQLSGFVVDWAEKTPAVAARVPEFRLFDADSKREAAELVDDPAAQKAGLEAALKQFQSLHDQHPPDILDLAALQGIGLTQYSLGNYAEAVKVLGPLVSGKKVGLPMEEADENGVHVERENTQYWEANYKLFNAALQQYKAAPTDKSNLDTAQLARRQVVNLFIIYGDKTGGKKYHDDFVNLKDEMMKVLPAPVAAKAPTPAVPAAKQ